MFSYNFVCTECALGFPGEGPLSATCPECGGVYRGRRRTLLRTDSAAFARWSSRNPKIPIRWVEPALETG